MNDLTDSENDSGRSDDSRYLKFIDLLVEKSIKRLESDSYKPRIQDALLAIRLKDKVFKTSEGEKTFWNSIEEMRREKWEEEQPPTDGLESEIKSTILELKCQVENGHLPVKLITDTFNQGRSYESQLTYHRVGHILTDMGFRKVKIHNNTSAILWDDDLLSQKGLSGDEKIENLPPPSPPSPPLPEVSLSPKENYTEGLLPPRVFCWRSS